MAVNRKDGVFSGGGGTVAIIVVGNALVGSVGGLCSRLLTFVKVDEWGEEAATVEVNVVVDVAVADRGVVVVTLTAVAVDSIVNAAGGLIVTVFLDKVSVVDRSAVAVIVAVDVDDCDVAVVVVPVAVATSLHAEPHRSICLTREMSAKTREFDIGLVWSHVSTVRLLQRITLLESIEVDSFASVTSFHSPGAPSTYPPATDTRTNKRLRSATPAKTPDH